MFKKLTSIILALVLVLSFTGCAQTDDDYSVDNTKSILANTDEDTVPQTDKNDKDNEKVSNSNSHDQSANTSDNADVDYVVNKNTKKFHKPYCRYVDDIKASNRWDYDGERSYLISKNYKPCKSCNP